MRREPAKSFRDLLMWQKAHGFVLATYRRTAEYPREELYGLTSQSRRAAVSVAANIAEGFKKRSRADKARLMNVAQGSAEECAYYLVLAQDLGYDRTADMQEMLDEVCRLLHAYCTTLLSPPSSVLHS
jgi:four helix bundle protein